MEEEKEVVVIDHSIRVVGTDSDKSDFSVICSDNTKNWHWVFEDDGKYSEFAGDLLRNHISDILVDSGVIKEPEYSIGSIRVKVTIESDIRQDEE